MSRKKKKQDHDINFWPAYVDALINVVLNLLFLVGVFTIGLVVLNGEAVNQEKKMAEIKVRELRHQEQTAPPVIANAIALLKALPSLERTETVKKNETNQFHTAEIRISNPRFAAKTDNQTGGNSNSAKTIESAMLMAQSIGGGRVVMRVEFEANEYTTPKGFTVLPELIAENKKKYLLLCISDPNNPRLAREAFARLMALRSTLTQAGVDATRIAIQVTPSTDDSTSTMNIDRSVFVIDLQN